MMQMRGELPRMLPNVLGRKQTIPAGWVMLFRARGTMTRRLIAMLLDCLGMMPGLLRFDR